MCSRNGDCHLSLSSNSVSRLHAEIFQDDGALWVKDLGSKNGTYLNRSKIREAVPLRKGDILHFGDVGFRIGRRRLEDEPDETVSFRNPLVEMPELVLGHEKALRTLLSERAVNPRFQPIIRMEDGSRYGFEVVGRGTLPGLPHLPDELFNIAEGLGFEVELSRLFWEEGLKKAAGFPDKSRLFLNAHPAELSHPDFLDSLKDMRALAGDIPLILEISERAVTDPSQMRQLKSYLKGLNMQLAYDDFGAGQARLLELVEVPPHFLKFDMCLVRGIHRKSSRYHTVVETLVHMASDLGIVTVAEGVECEEESQACARMGFQHAQGYYYGRPETAANL
ncbi:MAG: EAL domain-containing protein [Acidobacteriota bacterium]